VALGHFTQRNWHDRINDALGDDPHCGNPPTSFYNVETRGRGVDQAPHPAPQGRAAVGHQGDLLDYLRSYNDLSSEKHIWISVHLSPRL
jgi:hypothetical protein